MSAGHAPIAGNINPVRHPAKIDQKKLVFYNTSYDKTHFVNQFRKNSFNFDEFLLNRPETSRNTGFQALFSAIVY